MPTYLTIFCKETDKSIQDSEHILALEKLFAIVIIQYE